MASRGPGEHAGPTSHRPRGPPWTPSAPPSPARASSAPATALLGGVCSGVGRRFGIKPGLSRVIFVVLLMVLPGSQLLVYPLLWFLMPDEESIAIAAPGTPRGDAGA